MIAVAKEDYSKLTRRLDEWMQQETSLLIRTENAVGLITKSIQSLKEMVKEKGYPDEETEIKMNKEIIPLFFAQLIFYTSLHHIEIGKPVVSKKAQRKFYRNELYRIEDFFNQHREFIRYYRSGNTHHDAEYFTRQHERPDLLLDISFLLWDGLFCTSWSYKIAMLLGMERLKQYLLAVMEQTKSSWTNELLSSQHPPLLWTASKTDLIEMIYSWHAAGVFNNGKITIKEIVTCIEEMFSIKLGNTSTTFQEILRRKEYTNCLDKLKNALLMHVNRIEEKNIR